MARNPLNYTSKTFSLLYNEMRAIYPDRPDWFLKLLAGQHDKLHWYLDARAQNLLLSSAFTPEAIYDKAGLLDYTPTARSAGGGQITVTVDPLSVPITIPAEELTFRITTPTGNSVNYEALEDLTISTGSTGTAYIYEGRTVTGQFVGQSDGVTGWQEFVIPRAGILDIPISVFDVDTNLWTRQTTLVNSISTDKHFRVIRKPDDFYAIQFGDGEYGEIPKAGDITVTYRTGGGVVGNITQSGSTITYIGTNVNVVSATIDEDFNGGADEETLENIRFLAPKMLKTMERAITEDDYEYLSRKYSNSVILARAFPGLYGEGTVGVHVVPAGGGTPSTALKAQLESYLKERSVLGLSDIRVRDPFYVAEDISYAVKPRPGVPYLSLVDYTSLAARLLVSEKSKEVLDIYVARGISSVTDYINSTWGYSFTASDANTLVTILDRREKDGFNTWGSALRVNDIISAIDAIPQVDFVTVSVPAADVTLTYNQILTEGTITPSEIP